MAGVGIAIAVETVVDVGTDSDTDHERAGDAEHMNRVRTAVVGAVSGISRSCHLPVVRELPETELVALVDLASPGLTALGEEYGVPVFADVGDMLTHVSPDCVHVCSADPYHASQALAALRRGVHVLVEKPMALTVTDLRVMLAAAGSSGALLEVVQNDRYRAGRRAMQRAIASGRIGTPVYGRMIREGAWYRYPPDSPYRKKAGGGQIVHNGMHYLDTLCSLMDDTPASVYAQGARWFPDPKDSFETPNLVQALITMRSGHIAQLVLDQVRPHGNSPREEITIVGTEGLIRSLTGETEALTLENERGQAALAVDPDDSQAAFRHLIGAFSRAVADGTPVPIAPEYSAAVCAACLGIARSCETGDSEVLADFAAPTVSADGCGSVRRATKTQ